MTERLRTLADAGSVIEREFAHSGVGRKLLQPRDGGVASPLQCPPIRARQLTRTMFAIFGSSLWGKPIIKTVPVEGYR